MPFLRSERGLFQQAWSPSHCDPGFSAHARSSVDKAQRRASRAYFLLFNLPRNLRFGGMERAYDRNWQVRSRAES